MTWFYKRRFAFSDLSQHDHASPWALKVYCSVTDENKTLGDVLLPGSTYFLGLFISGQPHTCIISHIIHLIFRLKSSLKMLAYFVVVFSLIGVGIFKVLSMKSDLPPGLPLGFDEKPKPGMRLVQKLKELIRKIIRDKVRISIAVHDTPTHWCSVSCPGSTYFPIAVGILNIIFRIREIYLCSFVWIFLLLLSNYFMVYGVVIFLIENIFISDYLL